MESLSSDAWTNAQSEEWKVQPRKRGAICKGPEEKLLAIFEELDRINEKFKGLVLCFCTYVLLFFSSREDKVSGPRACRGRKDHWSE